MPVVAVLPALIGAAGAVGGTYIAARGTQNAAKTQAQAAKDAEAAQAVADKASLDFAKAQYADQYRQFEQQQANLGPYRDLGYSSLGALAGGLGLPAPAAPQTVPDTMMPPGLAALQNASSTGGLNPNAGFGPPGSVLTGPDGTAAPAASTPAPWNMGTRAQQLLSQYAPTSPSNEAPAGGGSNVTLRAPDGTVQSVPADQAAHYISLGAKPLT